jgi:type II secretory pathway pseudopilin PulG
MDSPVNHSDYEQLAAGFALGSLEPDEEQEFQRHLQGCTACQTTVREFEDLTASLAEAAARVEAPGSLRAAIRRRTGYTLRNRVSQRVGEWRGARITMRALAIVGALALVALSLWNLALRDQRQLDAARVASFEAAVRLVNDNTANRVTLLGSATDSGARATVLASSRQDRGVLVAEGLPQLAPGRVYELWGLPQGDLDKATKAAVFRFNSNPGVRTVAFSVPIQPTTAFAVTTESGPFGGEHPTTSPLLMGSPQPPKPGGA